MAGLSRWTHAVLALGLAAVGIGVAAPAHADVDDFTFDSFHADMTLSQDADGHARLTVVETIVARFPDVDQNRGIIRAIPDEDADVPYDTVVVSVTDAAGDPVPYEVSEAGDFVEVATGDDSYVQGAQTYVITYEQRDVVRAFDDTDADEFYRDINGTGWDQPFGEVSATIRVDAGIAASFTGNAACYAGVDGETGTCELSGDGGVFETSASDLSPGATLTVAIGFERGTFVPGEVERTAIERFADASGPGLAATAVGAGIVAVASVIGAGLVRRRGRDAAGSGLVVAQYAPPENVSVMQAAHLVGRGGTAVAAGIVDLAVRGHIFIVELEEPASGVSLIFRRPAPGDEARQGLLDAIFHTDPAPDASVWLGGDTQPLAKRLTAYSATELARVRSAGLAEPQKQGWTALALVVAVLAIAAAAVAAILAGIGGSLSWLGWTAVGVAIAAAVGVLVQWRTRDRVTTSGAAVKGHLDGLREYLRLAEADRLRMLQGPETALRNDNVVHVYERLLPYAIVFGLEKEWLGALELHEPQGPEWYSHPNGFTTGYLLASLTTTNSSTSQVAAWSSSGGSSSTGGSFGGGFAGGGAGGGGGGGR